MTDRPDALVRVALVGVLVLTTVIYLRNLGQAPVYLGWDEARTAVQAYSLATTGRDMNGTPAPLLFHITDPLIPNHSSVTWWQPLLFYMTAAVLRVAPLSQWSVRLPNVGLAILNVWLMYAVARRLFANPWYAVVAALVLALTPAHFFFARLAQDYFLPQTFALLWLLCLLRYVQTDRAWLPVAAGLVLGVGLYTHISSWLVMPFYLAVTSLALSFARKPLRAQAALWLGFAVALLPLIVWFWSHPSLLRDMFVNYGVVTSPAVAERVTLYWDYFNPSYLFFAGSADPMWSTRRAGIFLLAVAVLLPCGIWSIWARTHSIPRLLLLAGFFYAPVPIAVTMPEAPAYSAARDLLAVPFGVLISVAGVELLFAKAERSRVVRIVTVLLLLSLPIQFVVFARDYFSDYQLRSAFRHDFLNVREAVNYVVASDESARVPAVYLSNDVSAGKAVQWKFHLLTHHRPDLWERTKYFSIAAFEPRDIASGSLLVLTANNPHLGELIGPDRCTVVHVVKDVTDTPAASILRRN